MSKTSGKTQQKSKKKTYEVPVSELINNFLVVKETGYIYEIVPEKKNPNILYLRAGNRYQKFDRRVVAQGLVDGKYLRPNEHQLKKHIAKEQLYFQELTSKLVHRIVLGQALIECNDDLIKDYAEDKYIKNTLEKSNKQLARLVEEAYGRMYNTEPKVLTFCLEEIQKTGSKLGLLKPHFFCGLNNMLDTLNVQDFIPETVYIKSLGLEPNDKEAVAANE